jgi:hypothetical protein
MSVGAVGGLGGGMMAGGLAAIGAAGPLNFGGLNGALGNQNAMTGLSSIKMQQLSELIKGFSSAEILMALMIAAASGKKKDDDESGSALAILAGLAMAQQLGSGGCGNLGGIDLGMSTGGAASGMNCNVLA